MNTSATYAAQSVSGAKNQTHEITQRRRNRLEKGKKEESKKNRGRYPRAASSWVLDAVTDRSCVHRIQAT